MAKEYRHLRVMREQLEKYTDIETQSKILNGMDYIKDSSKSDIKMQWADKITTRLDDYLDEKTRIKVRENCACILSNEKSTYAQKIKHLKKQYIDNTEYLNAVVDYLNSTGRCGNVSLDGEKIITTISHNRCICAVLKNGLVDPISVTWCHCCKGSILSVIKHIFSEKECKMIIKGTVASGGKDCTFETIFK